jgi:hypothetical protein
VQTTFVDLEGHRLTAVRTQAFGFHEQSLARRPHVRRVVGTPKAPFRARQPA